MEPQENQWFSCPFCRFKCGDQTLFNQHYVKKHREEYDFSVSCSVCSTKDGTDVVYKNMDSFKSHLQRVHGSSKSSTDYVLIAQGSRSSTPTFPASEFAEEHNQPAPSGSGWSGLESGRSSSNSPLTCQAEEHIEVHPVDISVQTIDSTAGGDDAGDDLDSGSSDNESVAEESDAQDGNQQPSIEYWHSAKFLLSLREEALVSQSAINKAVDGVDELFFNYSQSIKEHLLKGVDSKTGTISEEHIQATIEQFQRNGMFGDLDSKKKLDSFAKKYCKFIEPQKVKLYSEDCPDKNGKVRVKTYYAYVCQFLPGLKRLLTRPDILECIDNPLEHTEGLYQTYQDGTYARKHPILSDPKNLGIQLCFDELEISSPLGPVKHKLGLYYWTLANIHPHLRSSLRTIGIVAIVNHSDLTRKTISSDTTEFKSLDDKYHMHCKVLAPFLSDIQKLEKGIQVEINQKETREFQGTLQSVTGDTPAVAVIGGFKESVGPAHKPCHKCLADHHEMKVIFNEDFFEKRTEANREIHLKSLINAATVKERQTNSTATGYNGASCISGLTSFNQISCFLYDTMHVILEGVLPAHMRLFLDYCVNVKHVYTVNQINQEVKSLSVQLSSEDRPAPIKVEHLQASLRQSASQMLRLATMLPIFMAGKCELEDRLLNFTLLLRITYGLLCYEVTDAEIMKLKTMIRAHHEQFMVDYPDFDITPKFHYLIHLPSQIQEFGPSRYTWSMRYESMHSYIKNIMRIIKNFKNPPKSCSYRYESLRACQMLSAPGEEIKDYLVLRDTFSGGKLMKLKDFSLSHLISPFYGNKPNLLIRTCNKFVTKGVEFTVGSVVLLKRDKPPEFGEITKIVSYQEITLLIMYKLHCGQYSYLSNSFNVLTPPTPEYIATFPENLAFFRPLLVFKYGKSKLVVPKYHNLILDYTD